MAPDSNNIFTCSGDEIPPEQSIVISGKDFLTYLNIDNVLSNKDLPLLPPLPTLSLESVIGSVLDKTTPTLSNSCDASINPS